MLRVMDLRDNRVELFEGNEHVAPPPPGVLRWIDLQDQDAPHLELLRQRFDFHPLAIEDCAQLDQRPKLEEYPNHVFLVIQGFASHGGDQVRDLELLELHAFLGERFLVTVHEGTIEPLERVWRRLSGEPNLLARGLDFVYYLLAD